MPIIHISFLLIFEAIRFSYSTLIQLHVQVQVVLTNSAQILIDFVSAECFTYTNSNIIHLHMHSSDFGRTVQSVTKQCHLFNYFHHFKFYAKISKNYLTVRLLTKNETLCNQKVCAGWLKRGFWSMYIFTRFDPSNPDN